MKLSKKPKLLKHVVQGVSAWARHGVGQNQRIWKSHGDYSCGKDIGLETCGTFGLLQDGMAEELKDAGLDYYNHNLDTAPENYHNVIGTRRFDDRLSTLGKVRHAGLKVCCGGIVGMNETRKERAGLVASLANL